jgi:hypothetical protein
VCSSKSSELLAAFPLPFNSLTCRRNKQADACRSNLATAGPDKILLQLIEVHDSLQEQGMTKMPTTDDSSDRETLGEAANNLTNDPIDQLHDILKRTTLENLKGVRQRGQTVLNMMEAAEVVSTVHGYAYMTSKRLQQIASLTQLGARVTNLTASYSVTAKARPAPARSCAFTSRSAFIPRVRKR